MAGIFGTDGVRARINTGPMRAESVVRLAWPQAAISVMPGRPEAILARLWW